MKILLLIFISCAFSLASQAQQKQKKITLITHESVPFMGESLPDKGALIYAMNKVLDKMNYKAEFVFVPSWARAKMTALKDPKIDGYTPYTSIENEDVFDFSDYFYNDPWVIIERKEAPIHWKTFTDLTKYTAGGVTGVELRPGVKELAEKGKLKVETTTTDVYNIKKLATKRVDMIFMDAVVFRYLMATESELQPYRNQLQVNSKPIIIGRYGLAVKKKNVSADFLPEFKKVGKFIEKYIEEYLTRLEKEKANKALHTIPSQS